MEWDRLLAALRSLPAAAPEAELLEAVAQGVCTHLGCSAACVRISEAGDPLASWPDGASVQAERAVPLGMDLLLETAGPCDAEALGALAIVAGKLVEEARSRSRLLQRIEGLTRRSQAAEDLHRDLTLRLAELTGELDTTLQNHVVLSERNRIAQDLHDRAAQTTFLLSLKLDWALAHLAPDDPMHAEIERLKELAAQATAQTREAIYALRAPEMAEGGLQGGLRRLVRSMEADGFTASLTVHGLSVPLLPGVEDALFKVAQEALNNIRKHSHGLTVMMALRFSPAAVTLVVQDDGAGLGGGVFEETPGRLGLKGMRERLAAVNGELQLISDEETGLIVRATIPLKGGEGHGDPNCHRG